MNALIEPDTHIITTIATTIAATMMGSSLTSPTAVNTESSENTISMSPICTITASSWPRSRVRPASAGGPSSMWWISDRKSTRLNSSHLVSSYAVFCLKKKSNHEDQKNIGTEGNMPIDNPQ